ncbi:hypothetical protein ElyMa_003572900 [Elysia marginata]|uniref:Transmembrane protein n=1 Tax=Elysia marginata TaxID=1093978 RepID=A0AAV4EMG0_9GAST|nr:hypothetical protein ElyMa_003572900 [Elysia marginata]
MIVRTSSKKRRHAHTDTRRLRPDRLGMSVFIPRRPSGKSGNNLWFLESKVISTRSNVVVVVVVEVRVGLEVVVLVAEAAVVVAVGVVEVV